MTYNQLAFNISRRTKLTGGCTINLRGEIPESGYCVGGDGGIEPLVVPVDDFCSEHALSFLLTNDGSLNSRHVGTWTDNGMVVIDAVRVYEDKLQALRHARSIGEKAIYDVVNKCEISTKLDNLRIY